MKKTGRLINSYYFRYFWIFCITAFFVYLPFIVNGRSFVWHKDGYEQNFRALAYYSVWLRKLLLNFLHGDFSIPAWSFGLGYGSDIITTLHYYAIGEPLYLFSALIPREGLWGFYGFAEVLRLFLAGVFFSVYLRYVFRKSPLSDTAVLSGALIYVFCGYSFVFIRHPYFIYPLEYLPLIFLGEERILSKKGGWVFSIAVFLSVVSNFYFFYMLAVAAVLYFLFRIFTEYRPESIRDGVSTVFNTIVYGIAGLLMGAVMLYPVILRFFSDPRTNAGFSADILYPLSYYFQLPLSFVGIDNPGFTTYLGYGALGLLSCICLFLFPLERAEENDTGIKRLRTAFMVAAVFLLLPCLSYALLCFSDVKSRWIWIYGFLVAVIVARMHGYISMVVKERAGLVTVSLIIYTAVCFIWNRSIPENVLAQLILAFLTVLLFLLPDRIQIWEKFITSGRMLLLITVIGIVANGYYLYSPREEDYAGDFSEIKDFDPEIRIDPEKYPDEWSTAAVNNFWYSDASLIHDASGDKDGREFIRMSGYEPDNNASLQAGISSTQYFWSLSDANIWQFFEEMANNEVRCYHYEGLDDRAALNALAAVNYYSVFDKDRIGYGFEDGEVDFGRLSWAYNVYKGSTYLNFGTFFNAYVDREDYEAMTPLQRQDVLLDGIVLDRPEEYAEGIRRVNTTYSPEELPYEIECESDDISIDNGRVTVTKPDSSLSLIFKGKENAETYLYIKGLEFEGRTQLSLYKDNDPDADPKDLYNSGNWKNLSLYDRNEMLFEDRKKPSFEEADIHVRFTGDEGDSCTKNLVYMTEKYNKYMNKHDFLVNSIYSEGAFNKVRLDFSNIGSFSFDEIKLYSVDIKNVTERIKSLKGCSLQNLDLHYRDDTYSTEKISGSIDTGEKGLLLLQIPYSKGWKAFVDEKEVPVLRADTMFMALPLDKGHHDIVMKYSTPGLKTGAIISIAGLIILLVSIAVSFYSKKAAFQGRDGEEKADSRRNIQ